MTDLKQNVFKYNMSFYYQSTITYFVLFTVYLIVRGLLVEDVTTPMIKDPIMFFFGIIVLVALLSLLYNLFLNRHIKVNEEGIQFIDKFRTRTLKKDEIVFIKFAHEAGRFRKIASRHIRIKVRHKRRPLMIRPNDYENVTDLMDAFRELKKVVEGNNV